MSLSFCFVVFLAIFTQSAKCQTYLTSDIIQQIFGDGKTPPAPQAGQAPALSPNNTLQDIDYSDTTDNYNPAPADFDRFDWTLTKRVAASADNNFLLSPLGLKLALAILTEAATGSTQAELASVLGFDLDKALVRKKFASILDSLQTKSSKYILNMGSRIYVGENGELRQRFAAIAENYYRTELVKIDFTKPVEAASSINAWVANTTQGRLPNLVNSDDVANIALLVLTTLYFKGTWVHQFTPNETTTHNFYVTAKDTKPVEFMNVRNKFYFTESAKFDAKILRMPYLGKKFAMYIVVPNTLTGLPRVYNSLSDLRAELYRLQRHLVDVSLPKFKFDYTSILDSILKELGIRQAFEDTASFPGIAHGQLERIKVSKILQCSGIEVNELGSTVYSATEITLENKFGEEESFYELVANRPFMFFIQDEETRQLLFTGRVSDPSNADGALKFEMVLIPFVVLSLLCFQSLECLTGRKPQISRFNFFDTDLLQFAVEDKKGNVVVSPASIKSVLAMLLEGAAGETAIEIRNALRLSSDKDEFREQLNAYLSVLKTNDSAVTLLNSNAIFVAPKVSVRREYITILYKVYLTEVRVVNFHEPVPTADLINTWVRDNTKGLINTLVEPEHLDPMSELMLANSLYFKSSWQHAFNPQLTRGACFKSQGKCQTVAMMELQAGLNYAYVDDLRAHAIELPYESGRYSMFLLVPYEHDGVSQLLRDLPYFSLPQIASLMEETDVRLQMPKFTIDYSDDMAKALRAMKIKLLFTNKADLSSMFNSSSQVSNIIHKVHIAVDETGTVAAAASSAMVIPLIENGVQIRVDRPFLFFIRDNKLGLVLFEGKVEEPIPYVEPKPVTPNVTEAPVVPKNITSSERKYAPKNFISRLFG
ncbi:PREDICTED: uncharacterized protein LOC106104033 [Papilio polytes]|uniref:uncharacterized protein LOC106104033 n=1 Tax=Papilio polytes TaxID=76194 RepID=UPI0006760684|nr:PREDICTED: uncharacterized protein LOC106104033 [Papilio polytes]